MGFVVDLALASRLIAAQNTAGLLAARVYHFSGGRIDDDTLRNIAETAVRLTIMTEAVFAERESTTEPPATDE